MDENLFRREAIAAFKERAAGVPIVPMPLGWLALTLLLFTLLSATLIFIVTQDYARKEKVTGWLRYQSGEFSVQSPISGIVSNLRVSEGDFVQFGNDLFSIHSSDRATSGVEVSQEIEQTIRIEKGALETQLSLIGSNLAQDLRLTQLEIDGVRNQITGTDAQIATAQRRISLLTDQLSRLRPLADQRTITRNSLQDSELELLSARDRLQLLQGERVALTNRIAQLQIQLAQLPTQAEERSTELRQRLAQLDRTLIETELRRGVAVQAPQSGFVVASKVRDGYALQAGERALSIVDRGSDLQAELYVPTLAMARIQPGLNVRVFYDAFPYRRYGVASGEVVSVSDTIFSPEEIPTPLGVETGAYRVRVRLDAQTVEGFGTTHALRGGMTLQAEIILERQNFLRWLLEPLQSAQVDV